MRKEVTIWFEQAKEDLEVAKLNHSFKKWYASVFFCQQSIEKALKALFIFKKNESPGQTHSLVFLSSGLGLDKKYFPFIQELTPEFVTTRYPDLIDESPYKIYGEEKSQKYLEKSEEVLEWIENQL